jgi:hypothetical protein
MNDKVTKRVERVQRKPLFQRGPQSIAGTKDPQFAYRFVNDTGSRITNFQQAGWEIVADEDLTVGDSRVKDAGDIGSGKRVVSDDGTVQYLMRIKKEWYDEDQKAKQEQVNETERAMKQDAQQDRYGQLKLSRD